MKKILLTTLVIVLALILFAIWLRQDDPLTPEAQAWQQWHEEHYGQPGEAYLWLLGLDAPAGEDPRQAGARWLELAREEYEQSDEPVSMMLSSPPAPWQDQRQARPDSTRLEALQSCRDLVEPPCDEMEDVLAEHGELLSRFLDWPVLSQSLTIALPDNGVTPTFSVLTKAVRLERLYQLRQLLQGEDDAARERIEAANQKLRSYLAGAPSLINLMVAIMLLADQVDWLLALERDGLIDLQPDDPLLAELDGVGQALEASLRYEFGSIYRFNQEFNNYVWAEAGWVELLAHRWFFKPGMATNQSAELHQWLAELDEPGDLSDLGRGNEPIWRGRFQLRNMLGYGSYNMVPSAEPYLNYVGRVHDLSARLALARAYLSEPQLDDAALRRMVRANPYRRGYGVELDEQRSRLCFDGPFEDSRQFRCLDVPLHDD